MMEKWDVTSFGIQHVPRVFFVMLFLQSQKVAIVRLSHNHYVDGPPYDWKDIVSS